MSSLKQKLASITADAFVACGYEPHYGVVIVSQRRELADYQCNGALQAAKPYKKKPRDIAQEVMDRLSENPAFSEVSIAGPGFINLRLSDSFVAEYINLMATDESGRCGVAPVADPLTILVDYGGANIAKPLHVGHLRAAIIGESLKRLCVFLGHRTLGDVHLGDWGLQMGQIITELERRHPDWIYFDEAFDGAYPTDSPVTIADLQEIYPAASARSKSDPEAKAAAQLATSELQSGRRGYYALWKHFLDISVADLKHNYGRLDVHFDLWLGESDTQPLVDDMVAQLVKSGDAIESDGALIVPIAEEGDKKEMAPLMLVKSNKSIGYGTTDLATLVQRMRDYKPDEVLYVVDGRQQEHFRQVFRAAYKSGIVPSATKLEHNYFGTMNGKDGKPFKTREGGIMQLNDLIAMIMGKAEERLNELSATADYEEREKTEIARKVGIAALKFADLVNHRTGDYVFDLDRFSSFEGRTGPYLLYAAVRTRSILRKAADQGLVSGELIAAAGNEERELQLKLLGLTDLLQFTFETRAPNHLCEYAYQLAGAFNRFYANHHILNEENKAQQASWLALSQLTVDVLVLVLDLLGIGVPERM